MRYYATELFSGIQQENGWRFHELTLFPSFFIYYYVGAEIHRRTNRQDFQYDTECDCDSTNGKNKKSRDIADLKFNRRRLVCYYERYQYRYLGALASTTLTAAKTSGLKRIPVFSIFVAFIPIC